MTETQPQRWEWMTEVAAGGFILHRLFKDGHYMATAVSHESKIPELTEHLNAQDTAVATLRAALEDIIESTYLLRESTLAVQDVQYIAHAALKATKEVGRLDMNSPAPDGWRRTEMPDGSIVFESPRLTLEPTPNPDASDAD